MRNPLIIDIKGNSLDDGPGIRSVIFFKGCPLSCVWCHNPESRHPLAELSFDPQKCISCGSCIEKCQMGALSRDNIFFVDRKKCTICFECATECPTDALSRIGQKMTQEEIIEKVLKDKPFFDSSGGGVTFSGGEPTLHMDFLSGLLKSLKEASIHTLIETCGYFNFDAFKRTVLPYTDMVFMDIKFIDPMIHKHYCGLDNTIILENFVRLHELSLNDRFRIIPRIPLIPGITNTEINIVSIARFLYKHQVKEIRMIPNNPLWHDKCANLGIMNSWAEDSPMRKWLTSDEIDISKGLFENFGIKTS